MLNTSATSPGTMTDDASVGTRTWANPDNAKVSDNVYALITETTSTSTSHYLKATNFGFSIPAGSRIDGILAEIEKKGSVSGSRFVQDSSVVIVKANGSYGSTNKGDLVTTWLGTDGYISYGGVADLWGETWTATDINNSNFGFAISSKNTNDGMGNTFAFVDHMRITIYYTMMVTTITNVSTMTNISTITT